MDLQSCGSLACSKGGPKPYLIYISSHRKDNGSNEPKKRISYRYVSDCQYSSGDFRQLPTYFALEKIRLLPWGKEFLASKNSMENRKFLKQNFYLKQNFLDFVEFFKRNFNAEKIFSRIGKRKRFALGNILKEISKKFSKNF